MCLILALAFVGAGSLGAQDSIRADSLPVSLQYREREVRVEFRLAGPGHLVVFNVSTDDVEVLSPDDATVALSAGPHRLALPRPRQWRWSPLLDAGFGPCTEAVPTGLGDGMRYAYTGACGLRNRVSGDRAAAVSPGPPVPAAVVDAFLVAILPSPRGNRELRGIAGMADNVADRSDSILKALGAREEGVRWVVIVVR